MRRTGQIATDTLIRLAIVVVIFLVVFLGILPQFQKKAEASGGKAKCEWSVLLAGLSKAGSLNLAQGIPEGCKAKTVVVTMKDVQGRAGYARNRLKVIQDPKHREYDATSKYFRTAPLNDNLIKEFALDNIVADELVECWEKVWKGKVPLFNEWWRLYDVCVDPNTGKSTGCGKLEEFAKSAWAVAFNDANKAPTNCILCAHISFDPEVQKIVRKPEMMMEWLGNNPVPRTSAPYSDFLAEGQTIGGFAKLNLKYDFSTADPGIAIMYERINTHQLFQSASSVGNWAGLSNDPKDYEDQSYLKLLTYKQDVLNAPTGDCNFILD